MWKKDKKRIMMNEGDYGISLPITISGAEIALDEKICFYIIDPNYMVVLIKEYTNIENNTFDLCLTKNESKKLNQGCYRYKIDWCKDDVFKGTIVESEIFEVRKNCVEGILEEEEVVLNLQIKTAIPSKEQQSITYDEEYDALGEVVVEPIPEEYIKPEGTLEVTTNGEYDVTTNEKVNVNVSIDEYIFTGSSSSSNAIINRIVKIPVLDLTGNYSANQLCKDLISLKEVSELITSKTMKFQKAFSGCINLEKIALLDFTKANDINGMINNCPKLTILGGFKNLGSEYSITASANFTNYELDLSSCTLLTHESLMNVINNLYDIKTKGCQVQNLVLGSTNLEKLTEEEIAIATNKGWAVS